MTADDRPSLQHSLAGLSRWAGIDPDERTRRMTELSARATAKRAAERSEREAAGIISKPKRRTRSVEAMPPIADLLPLIEDIQRQRVEAGLAPLAPDALIREASLRLRRTVAESTYRALKGDS